LSPTPAELSSSDSRFEFTPAPRRFKQNFGDGLQQSRITGSVRSIHGRLRVVAKQNSCRTRRLDNQPAMPSRPTMAPTASPSHRWPEICSFVWPIILFRLHGGFAAPSRKNRSFFERRKGPAAFLLHEIL
jgi:hypothetical protein